MLFVVMPKLFFKGEKLKGLKVKSLNVIGDSYYSPKVHE